MMSNLWTIKDFAANDKNLVIFSLKSMGRSDLASVPAGGKRANNRANSIKEQKIDITLKGNQSRVTAHKPQKKQSNPVVSNKVALNKGAPARPSGFKRVEWAKLSLADKIKTAALFPAPKGKKKPGKAPQPKAASAKNVPFKPAKAGLMHQEGHMSSLTSEMAFNSAWGAYQQDRDPGGEF
jgi:hypothetical protein